MKLVCLLGLVLGLGAGLVLGSNPKCHNSWNTKNVTTKYDGPYLKYTCYTTKQNLTLLHKKISKNATAPGTQEFGHKKIMHPISNAHVILLIKCSTLPKSVTVLKTQNYINKNMMDPI